LWDSLARAIYYWKDIFNETNLTEKDIKNWDAFENSCKKIKGQFRGNISAFGIPGGGKGKEWLLAHNIIPWVYGSGGEIIVHKPLGERELGLSRESAMDGLMFYIDLSLNRYTGPNDFNATKGEIEKGFLNKKYAMIYSGPWLLKPLKDLDREGKINIDNVGTALPPAGKAGTYTFVGGSNLAIWHYQDGGGTYYDAWEFVKFLSADKDSQKRYANATMMIPASREALEEFITVDLLLKPFRNALVAGYGRSFPSIKEWGEIEDRLVDNLNSTWKIVGKDLTVFSRRAMVKTELEQTDETCYWILNHGWKWRIWKHLPQCLKEVILFGSNYLNQMLAIIAFVSFALALHGLFKRKDSKEQEEKIATLEKEKKVQEEKIADLEKENAELKLKANLPERNFHDPKEHQ
jgi:multiple sugar transport system substrate-binding protein